MKISMQSHMKAYEKYLFELIRTLKPQLIFVAILLMTGIILGFTNVFDLNEFIDSLIESIMHQFKDYRGLELFARILLNNSRATAIALLSGIIFSILPTLASLVNGMLIGFILQSTKYMAGRSVYEMILALLPHGVFEIPALILSFAFGIKMGGWLFSSKKIEFFKHNFKEALNCYVRIILPLLIIAACIETVGIEAIHYMMG